MSIEDLADMLRDAAVWTDSVQREQVIASIKSEHYKQQNRIERLIDFSAQAGVAFREDDTDTITEGFRALPDDLQALINEKEEQLDKEFLEAEPLPAPQLNL